MADQADNVIALSVSRHKAEEMLANATSEFESRFANIFDAQQRFLTPTGETHIEVVSTSGGMNIRFPAPDLAVSSWLENSIRAAPAEAKKLYWRVRPEIDLNMDGWAVYGRFCVTNKSEEV